MLLNEFDESRTGKVDGKYGRNATTAGDDLSHMADANDSSSSRAGERSVLRGTRGWYSNFCTAFSSVSVSLPSALMSIKCLGCGGGGGVGVRGPGAKASSAAFCSSSISLIWV